MADRSSIEWTDATWNPVTGCSKVSPGCRFCYAERLSKRFGRSFDVQLHPDRLDLPHRWKEPRRVFVNSMSDLFHPAVPDKFISRVFESMRQAGQHVFQVLTKRPERIRQWLDKSEETVPDHVWMGVSIESARYYWRADCLRQIPARTRFISAEPLLGSLSDLNLAGISWLITGGESGGTRDRSLVETTRRGLRPKTIGLSWVRELRDKCLYENVAFFHKQWGGPWPTSAGRRLDGREWNESPAQRSLIWRSGAIDVIFAQNSAPIGDRVAKIK